MVSVNATAYVDMPMAATGLLILSSPQAKLGHQLGGLLASASRHVSKTLYVQLDEDFVSRLHDPRPLWSSAARLDDPETARQYGHFTRQLYANANMVCRSLDVRLLMAGLKRNGVGRQLGQSRSLDVVLTDDAAAVGTAGAVADYVAQRFGPRHVDAGRVVQVDGAERVEDECHATNVDEKDGNSWKLQDQVCLGGTFDRLHNGHKILLTEAVLLCRKRLVVGISYGQLVDRKILSELIEPLDVRMRSVREFLEEIDGTVQYDMVPLNDPFGPTTSEPDLQCLVVSEETLRGGIRVNDARRELGMNPLDIHSVGLLAGDDIEEHDKLSSTAIRKQLLGRRRHFAIYRPRLPRSPYLVGLTGGIASGKSSIAERLRNLGAGIVDCDKMAHEAYAPGTAGHRKVVEHFGGEVVSADGTVDRRALAAKVFGNKDEMERLNEMVWPEVKLLVNAKVKQLAEAGARVVVVEAVLLVEAGWHEDFHELWVAVIPREEAIRRIVERNAIDVTQAEARIKQQPTNKEMLLHANVVFSTLWSSEFTQIQVERAWNELHKYLDCSVKSS